MKPFFMYSFILLYHGFTDYLLWKVFCRTLKYSIIYPKVPTGRTVFVGYMKLTESCVESKC